MFCQVALFSPPFATLTYSLPDFFPPEFWRPGLRVLIPVGKSLRAGVLLSLSTTSNLPGHARCRDIFWPLELSPLISGSLLKLATDLALRQGLTPGAVLGNVLPAGLRGAKLKIVWQNMEGKKQFTAQTLANLPNKAELARALVSGAAVFAPPGLDLAEAELCSLCVDPPWPLRPAAKRQAAILDYLYERGQISKKTLFRDLGQRAAAPLQKLLCQKLVQLEFLDIAPTLPPALLPPPDPEFQLNADQNSVLSQLLNALNAPTAQTRLLHGVTGSGKTAVYLKLAREALSQGKSVLLLAPEVALAHKLHRDAQKALPENNPVLYHGYQHPARREAIFRDIAGKKQVMVVGTRSSLFLPLPDPGLIILDEEHDGSYKQDEKLAYHAKEVAWFLMKEHDGLLVLGSATPDIRVFHAGKTGQMPILSLPNRIAGNGLPPLRLVRLGASAGKGTDDLLAPESEAALRECVANGEQAVILLNRRGYAPLIFCTSCQQTVQCPNCQIGLSYHKGIGRLVCHYCGYAIPWPGPCPRCGDSGFVAMGEGTEKIAEQLEIIAGQPILRLDRDSARRPGRLEEILTEFGLGKSPFLVGTQMLSKGHHFPNVTLVVVADGDIGLNLPDYRASERTFQLLIQAAGRAGRGEKPGRAIIQTRKPDHYCWSHLLNYDYEGFYKAELALRQKYHYPPFICLGLLRISHDCKAEAGAKACAELGQYLKTAAKKLNLLFMGPTPAPLSMLNGRKRFQCLMKAKTWEPMRQIWFMAQKHTASKHLRLFLDLDPVNMM